MNDWRRRLEQLLERLSPRERVLVGAAAAVTAVLTLWLIASTLADRRHVLAAQITASEHELRDMQALRDRYQRLRMEDEVVRRKLASGGADFSLFSHLESVTREVLARERVAAMNPSTRNVNEELQEEDVEMRLSGISLRELVALLYRIEKGELPLLVSRLQVKKRFDQPYVFDVTLVVARLRTLVASRTAR